MELLRLLSANEIIAQMACFLILLAIMRAVFWKKVLAALDKRKERICLDLKNIETLKASALNLKADYERRLSLIEREARDRIRQAVDEGAMEAEEIRKKAELDARRILEKSKEHIKSGLLEAREELKNEIVDLTIAVTEKIIQEKYTEADDKRLIEDYIDGLEKR